MARQLEAWLDKLNPDRPGTLLRMSGDARRRRRTRRVSTVLGGTRECPTRRSRPKTKICNYPPAPIEGNTNRIDTTKRASYRRVQFDLHGRLHMSTPRRSDETAKSEQVRRKVDKSLATDSFPKLASPSCARRLARAAPPRTSREGVGGHPENGWRDRPVVNRGALTPPACTARPIVPP